MKEMINVQKKSMRDYLYSDKAKTFVFVLFLALEFIFAVRVGYGIFDAAKVYGAILLFVLYWALDKSTNITILDFPFIILCIIFFMLGIHQFLFDPLISNEWDPTPYAWVVPTIYVLGKLCVGNSKRMLNERGFKVLAVLAVGMYIQAMLNYYEMFVTYDRGKWVESGSFWNTLADGTKNTWAFGFMLIIGTVFYTFKERKRKKAYFILTFLLTLICLFITMFFTCRQVTVIAIVCNMLMALIYVFSERRDILKYKKRNIYTLVISLVILMLIFAVLFINNFMGVHDIYDNSFLSRDGGIFKNSRLYLWKDGLIRLFTIQKGGWDLYDLHQVTPVHNAWLDYGRVYDVSFFILWVIFLLTTLIPHWKTFFKYKKEYPVLYFALSAETALFMHTLIEPLFIFSKDLIVLFVLLFGINSGIMHVLESGDYSLLNTKYRDNNYRNGFVALGLLSFALLANCYMDWWKDRLDILITFVSPLALFLIGLMFFKHKKEQYILITGGIICSIAGIIYEYINSGSIDWALLIIPASLIIGIIFDRVKLNNLMAGIISVVLSGIILLPKITDGRMFTLIESVRFLKDTGKATSWIYSSLNTSGIISSHNMWMDFTRDYGTITLGILAAFELWMIYCFIRVVISQNKSLTNYFLIASFILFNYHFMIEATAFSNKYIFAIGMLIYGMICRASAEQNTNKDASEQNE